MKTSARLPAVFPSKSYIDRTPPPNGQPSTAPGQQTPQPAPAEALSLPAFFRPFSSLSILLLESLQNPPYFTVNKRRNGNSGFHADATGTEGEPSHFRSCIASRAITQYLHSITYSSTPHFDSIILSMFAQQ